MSVTINNGDGTTSVVNPESNEAIDFKTGKEAVRAELLNSIVVHPDFPSPGVQFIDIFAMLKQPYSTRLFTHLLLEMPDGASKMISPESRGFLFAPFMAASPPSSMDFIPVRKTCSPFPGPFDVLEVKNEYASRQFLIPCDSVKEGEKVIIFDDVLATGDTVKTIAEYVRFKGAEVLTVYTIIALTYLNGVKLLEDNNIPLKSLLDLSAQDIDNIIHTQNCFRELKD